MRESLRLFIQSIFPQFMIDWLIVEPLLGTRKLNRGEMLFHEGDAREFVGLTLKGCLRMFFLKDGKELTLFFHPEHYPVGDYQNFRLHQPACFSCQAIEDSEVLILNQQVIRVLESAPDGQQLMRLMVEYLAFRLRDRLLSLYRDTPEQRSYLIRLFRQSVGMPPYTYLNQIRVEKAKQFLNQGISIAETAIAVGMSDQSHLTRHFKRIVGVSPGHYRAMSTSFKTG